MRRATVMGAVVALLAGAAGLVMAQDQSTPPVADGSPVSAPTNPSPVADAPAGNATSDAASLSAAAPPEEAAPPPPAPVQEAQAPEPPAAPAPPPPPLARPRFLAAIVQATDKVTAETLRFEVRVGEPVRYRGLVITPRACEATAGDEPQADSFGYLDITAQPAPVAGRPTPAPHDVFHGWMSANAPSLNPLESAGYDVWVIACKTPAPPVAAGHA